MPCRGGDRPSPLQQAEQRTLRQLIQSTLNFPTKNHVRCLFECVSPASARVCLPAWTPAATARRGGRQEVCGTRPKPVDICVRTSDDHDGHIQIAFLQSRALLEECLEYRQHEARRALDRPAEAPQGHPYDAPAAAMLYKEIAIGFLFVCTR